MRLYLQNVRIRDFRTFGKFDLNMAGAPGLLIVTGPNGLGKSSFFDAIEWGLTSRVNRFERFRRGNTEANYLTREGSEPFSHAVGLTFTDCDRFERSGSADGSTGISDDLLKSLLVSPSWGPKIESLSTYLALTHFLGQGSQQRFISRDATDQWNALRIPSGVERLEDIRKRLRGRSATIALNRKGEIAAAEVKKCDDNLARWDALIQRLHRLQSSADVAGALPREQILGAVSNLYQRISPVASNVKPSSAGDLPRNMARLRTTVLDANKSLDNEEGRLKSLARLPDQHAELTSRQAAVNALLLALQTAKRDSEVSLLERRAAVERLDVERRQLSSQLQRLRERAAALVGAQNDLRDIDQGAQKQAALEKSIVEAEDLVTTLRKLDSTTDTSLEVLQTARGAVAEAARQHSAAGELVAEASALRALEAQLVAALSRKERAQIQAPQLSDAELAKLEANATTLARERQSELAAKRERAGAISAALTTILAHLNDHDTDCPLCKSQFPVGELKRLARLSAGEVDATLPSAQALLDEAQRGLQLIQTQRADATRAETEIAAATRAVDEARIAMDARRNELLAHLEILEPSSDMLAVAYARQAEKADALETARRVLASLEASQVEIQRMRNQTRDRLQHAEAQLEVLRTDVGHATSDVTAAQRRFQARVGEEGLAASDVPVKLAEVQAESDKIDAALKAAGPAYSDETELLTAAKAEDTRLAGLLTDHTHTLSQLAVEIAKLSEMWSSYGLPPPPAHATLEQKLSEFSARRSDLKSIDAELGQLVIALEVATGREELNNVRSMVEDETGGKSAELHRAALEASVAQARSQATRIKAARDAILSLAERLQNEADSYSNRFLRPLNDLISAFNDALLTSPGTSVFFNADYFADRTEFSARIRRRTKAGAPPVDRTINPQLILSEGQLAANGLSMLCSASVSYPWSRWQALLLDDPLQHNDVIHAAAFADMMRNLVGLKGYQVLMSSHDRVETEFIERKFSAADLPCTVLQLIAESPAGVSYEVRNNTAAQEILHSSSMRRTG